MFWTKKPSDSTPKRTSRSRSKPASGSSDVSATASSTAARGAEEQIRVRAYQLFLERGGHGGSAEQDWLQAEAEIRAGQIT